MNKIILFSIFYLACLNIVVSQAVSTFAGSGTAALVDGTGTNASFYYASGICTDANYNIYVADQYNNAIRKITPAGVVSTLAGSGLQGATDGQGSSATFNRPYCICSDPQGNLYVGEIGNHKIRKITPTGLVSTIAGSGVSGSIDGTGSAASFNYPNGICIDTAGNLFVADFFNHKIRKVTQAGVVTTFAGSGTAGSANGTGLAATFNGPSGITIDKAGSFYISEYYNNKIRKMTPTGVVSTLAGSGSIGSTDATGTAASFNGPGAVYADSLGNIYVADTYNNKIRKINSSAVVTTVAGSGIPGGSDSWVNTATFDKPIGICCDTIGNIFVADIYNHRIRRIGNCSPPVIPNNTTPNLEFCAGVSATLTASSTGTITWYTVASGGTAINTGTSLVISNTLTPGTYTYYTQANTCTTSSNRAAVIFTVNPLPSISVNSGTICSGQIFTLSPSGGLTYTYSSGSSTVNPLTSTAYTITGANSAGCKSSAISNVTVFSSPVISVNSGTICVGNSFTINPSGGSTYTFSSGSAIVTPTINSYYSVSTSNSSGCIATAISSVIVKPLPNVSVNSGSICAGKSFTMAPSGAQSYSYSSGSTVVTPTVNSSYTVIGTSTTGCVNSAICTVSVTTSPVISVASGSICGGQSFTLLASGANTYTYSSGAYIVSPSVTTSYSVSGTANNGCISLVPAVATVSVFTPTITITGSSTVCSGQQIILTASGANSYTWNNSSTTNTISDNPISNTQYIVTGQVGNCSNSTGVNVAVIPLPSIVIYGTATMLCSGQSATLSAGGANSYTWNTGSNNAQIAISPTATTTYTLYGTDVNGCVNNATFTESVSACTSLKNFTKDRPTISVYPNPSNGNYTLFIDQEIINSKIEIYNSLGSLINTLEANSNKTVIDLQKMANGIYIIKVEEVNIKVIKQ